MLFARILFFCAAGVLGVWGAQNDSSTGTRTIHFAALLPVNYTRFPFAYQNVLPALKLAVDNVTAPEGPLPDRDIQVHFQDSECSSAAAMNQMYNFYIQKKVHHVRDISAETVS